jgi:hypothetical protein
MIDRSSSPIVDFLQRSLVGGAVGVPELEVKAREAALLGERQQIQRAKAFKKAKKALGIRSIRKGFGSGGKWVWLMPPPAAETAIVTIANSNLEAAEQPSVRDARPTDKATPSRKVTALCSSGYRAFSASTTCDALLGSRSFAGTYFWEIATAS